MATNTSDLHCWLLDLPDELKLNIVNCLDRRRDLYNLSQTCRALEDMTVKRLYHNVDVEIPQSKTLGWNVGALPMFRSHVVQSVRELSIRNGYLDLRNPVYSRRRRSDAGSVDGYVCNIISRVPEDQLEAFSFLHQTPVSPRILDLLASRHKSNLRQLSVFELASGFDDFNRIPCGLDALDCRSVRKGNTIGKIVDTNRNTLERLRLGQEKALVESYRRSAIGFLHSIPQPVEPFMKTIQFGNLPNLREVALCGLNIAGLVPSSIPQALFFCKLQRLALETCPGSAEFLESMAATFHHVRNAADAPRPRITPQLTEFLFRHEAPTNHLKDSLIRFLSSFSGLKTLSLLFENATFLDRPYTLIAGHGPTLTTLVLESRIQCREHLGLDTSRPFGVGGYSSELWEVSINDISSLCPNLEEVGMGFPWEDELVRLRKTRLPTLTKLRTIHIRNFPESQVLSQLGDYSIKEYATKFVEWAFPPLVGGSRPSLEILAIGPTLYESRWKSSATRRQPPEFLRTHYFCLDWAKTRFGRWSPMVTGVSEKYMEEVREEKPLSGVFELVWLR